MVQQSRPTAQAVVQRIQDLRANAGRTLRFQIGAMGLGPFATISVTILASGSDMTNDTRQTSPVCHLSSVVCHFIRASGENEPRLATANVRHFRGHDGHELDVGFKR